MCVVVMITIHSLAMLFILIFTVASVIAVWVLGLEFLFLLRLSLDSHWLRRLSV